MSIWDRLNTVIKSYVNDLGEGLRKPESGFGSQPRANRDWTDPDVDAAFEELNDYLNGKSAPLGDNVGAKPSENARVKTPPEELRPDFAELDVPFGASPEECKAAYKKLLMIHHPDRHASHEGNFKKATNKTARLNAAWDRIEKWRNES